MEKPDTIADPTHFTAEEVVLSGITEISDLSVSRRTLKRPAAGQVTIKMEATGISFAEQAMRRDRYPGQPKFPMVPGYDLVGTVVELGPDVDTALLGQRVAALTKTGGWGTYVQVDAKILLPVPTGIDPAEAETLVVNGITAWQMLHREAKIKSGQTIVVHGANGGVGSLLTQLAILAGVRVIGLASPRHHDTLRAQGVEPLDYHDADLFGNIRQLAPGGVDAVFDNVGGKGVVQSFKLLKPGGTLVSYAIASATKGSQSLVFQFIGLLAQLLWWDLLPNGRRAVLYHIWAGKSRKSFIPKMRADFAQILDLLKSGALTPAIAARFPLEQISEAMALAESRTVYGKVILVP